MKNALGTVSTVDALAAELRKRILNGDFKPGEPLREVEIAGTYGVGRNSVRASLQALVHEGLLHHEAHRGATVPRLTLHDVADLFLVRAGLESEAVRQLVERRVPLAGAADAVARLERLDEDVAWGEVVELDLRFHRELFDALGSTRMSRVFESLQAELRLVLAQYAYDYGSVGDVAQQHRRLLDAIASGRLEVALHEVRTHLDEGFEQIVGASARRQSVLELQSN